MALQSVDTQAHLRATRDSVQDIAAKLQAVLGQELTALIIGIGDAKAIGKWASGKASPRSENETVLRFTYRIVEMLLTGEQEATVRAWMRGMNPLLDDRAPARLVREQPEKVLQAARALLAGD
jgi:hypothetical protein